MYPSKPKLVTDRVPKIGYSGGPKNGVIKQVAYGISFIFSIIIFAIFDDLSKLYRTFGALDFTKS